MSAKRLLYFLSSPQRNAKSADLVNWKNKCWLGLDNIQSNWIARDTKMRRFRGFELQRLMLLTLHI